MSLFLQQGVDLENQNWQLVAKYRPHGSVLHGAVLVNQDVAESDDLLVFGDAGNYGFVKIRQFRYSFSDYSELAFRCRAQQRAASVFGKSLTSGKFIQQACRV